MVPWAHYSDVATLQKLEREARGTIERSSARKKARVNLSSEESTALFDLLSKLLRFEPELRPSAKDIYTHPWFTSKFPQTNPR